MKVVRYLPVVAAILTSLFLVASCDLSFEGSAPVSLSVNFERPSAAPSTLGGGSSAKLLLTGANYGEITLTKNGHQETASGDLIPGQANSFYFRSIELGRYTITVNAYDSERSRILLFTNTFEQNLIRGRNPVTAYLHAADEMNVGQSITDQTIPAGGMKAYRYAMRDGANALFIDVPANSSARYYFQDSAGREIIPDALDFQSFYRYLIDRSVVKGAVIVTIVNTGRSPMTGYSFSINEVPRVYFNCTIVCDPNYGYVTDGNRNPIEFLRAKYGVSYSINVISTSPNLHPFINWTFASPDLIDFWEDGSAAGFVLTTGDAVITANFQ